MKRLRSLVLSGLVLAVGCGPKPATIQPPKTTTTPDKGAAAAAASAVPVDKSDPFRGSDGAYVTVVVFNDFLSPRCVELATVLDQLREKYPWDVLRIVYKHDPSTEYAHAKLAATTGQGVYTAKGADAFFRYKDDLTKQRASMSPEVIRKAAITAGLSAEEVQAGLEAGSWTEKVERDVGLAKSLGVSEAPASFVNGVALAGVPTLDVLKDTVEVELAKAKVLERSGVARTSIYAQAVAANLRDPKNRPQAGNELEDPKTVWKVPVGASPVRGKPTALVTLVAFSEFDCAYCKQAAETVTRVRNEYADKVRIVWKDLPQPAHGRSIPAANLARAARAQKGDAGFWDVHDRLFAAGKLDDADLELLAKNASLETKGAMAAVRADTFRRDFDADGELADDVEARGTPHFFLNGRRLVGAQPFEKFKAILDEEVKKAEALVRGGIAPSGLYAWIIKDGRTGEPRAYSIPPNPSAPFRGTANAPVLVQEFCDFQAPECRRIEPTVEELLKAFPGKIKVAWRDFPQSSHPEAPLAAEAAREALAQKGSDGFFKLHTKIFGNQTNLKREDLETYAKESGLDMAKVGRSLDAHSHRPAVESDARVATEAQLTSVPVFAVGGYVLQGQITFGRLSRLIERVLAEQPSGPPAKPGPRPGPGPVADGPRGDRDPPPSSDGKVKFSVVDLVVGTGRAVKTGDSATIHYRGRLLNGNEVDSSSRKGPFTFTLGSGMVIQGWERGLIGMRVGGKRRITIPPELAYGNHGSGSTIPPNAALVFDIDLISAR